MSDWVEQETWREAHREEIKRTMRYVWAFWLAGLGEALVLTVFVFAFADPIREAGGVDGAALVSIRVIFICFALVTVGVAILLRRYAERWRIGNAAADAVSSTSSSAVPWGVLYRVRATFPVMIATGPCPIGFVMFWVEGDVVVFLAFVLASVLALLWHVPRTDELVRVGMQFERERTAAAGTAE
jgi:hypothetical protein